MSDDALRAISADYTREAGVRSLEREIGRLLRKVATKLASGSETAPVVVGADDVRTWLGRPRFFFEAADRTAVPGVATGLAVTGTGGDVLFVEATVMDGTEGLTLTGQLGDVMKESAEIALSFVRSHAAELGIDPAAFTGKRFHVHVPAGAVPKDGPSAGVTMTTALVSLLRDQAVRPVVGMTGEVTLQGRVLPIGGVKQKVLAAHRAGLTDVILPVRNGPDLEDVPESVREEMRFHLAETVDDVLPRRSRGARIRRGSSRRRRTRRGHLEPGSGLSHCGVTRSRPFPGRDRVAASGWFSGHHVVKPSAASRVGYHRKSKATLMAPLRSCSASTVNASRHWSSRNVWVSMPSRSTRPAEARSRKWAIPCLRTPSTSSMPKALEPTQVISLK